MYGDRVAEARIAEIVHAREKGERQREREYRQTIRDEFVSDEDFITRTIREVDEMLRGERAEELRAVSVGASADEWDTASMAEYEEWSREISEQNDREQEQWWAEHCPVHGDDLHDGVCLLCAQEERRCDM